MAKAAAAVAKAAAPKDLRSPYRRLADALLRTANASPYPKPFGVDTEVEEAVAALEAGGAGGGSTAQKVILVLKTDPSFLQAVGAELVKLNPPLEEIAALAAQSPDFIAAVTKAYAAAHPPEDVDAKIEAAVAAALAAAKSGDQA